MVRTSKHLCPKVVEVLFNSINLRRQNRGKIHLFALDNLTTRLNDVCYIRHDLTQRLVELLHVTDRQTYLLSLTRL